MGRTIGEILPLAVALAAGPLPVIAIMLILVSDEAKAKGLGFVIGRIAGLAALVAVGLVIFTLIDDPALADRGHPRPAMSVARIVIGVALIALAWRNWRRRNEPSKPSALTRRVDSLTPRGSVGLGLVVSVIDPASLSLGFLSGVDIAAARLPVATAVIVACAFVVLSTLTITVPLAGYLAGGQAARDRLVGIKGWLQTNEKAVMMVLFLLIGAMLIGRGIRDLAVA
ncbi:GAP family protein [Mycobacterium sp. ACS1612]|uniref:GAP family protein n=1 Tax=Mycobacterium sp. ACS1612 TaxID=1834117 RepID=UPI000A9C3144|nr:GAP family protein [Mycobacterium sp. ACS1612]